MTFIDFDKDGLLDFIIQKASSSGKRYLDIVYNNVSTDNFFVETMFLNEPQRKSKNWYGNAAMGVSYRFVTTGIDDQKLVQLGNQQTQSGYASLQLPYAYMGIGRSNNYLETLYCSTSVEGTKASRMWTPIIPNSQLVVFGKSADPETWMLELFINPTQKLFMIVIVSGCVLVAIGIAIIWLYCLER